MASRKAKMNATVLVRMTRDTVRVFNRTARKLGCSRSILIRDLVYREAARIGTDKPEAK